MSEYIVDFKNAERVSHFESLFADFTAPIHEEIVRCRDCKEFMNGDLCKLQDEWNEFHWLQVEPDGFCKWASRKDNNEEDSCAR